MATVALPDSIERQLLTLDRQVRDATFSRGISRLALVVPIVLGVCLFVDWYFGLSSGIRIAMLGGWVVLALGVLWREVLGPLWRPPSLPELAALVERQHPELKERLTSLVELQEQDATGASPVMRELLARQTAKAVNQLDLTDAAPAIRSAGTSVLALAALVLLLSPFAFFPTDYGLLWARLFAPWGNFHWGSTELIVVDGDRVVAKGTDVPIQIEVRSRRKATSQNIPQEIVWLHWTDDAGIQDSRRLEWDVEAERFATTLPHITRSLQFHATTTDAQSEVHQVTVADPPAITSLQLDVEPPAYTGLPARALDGAQGEIRAAERSRVIMKLQFSEAVNLAELVWPIPPEAPTGDNAATEKPRVERIIPMKIAADKRSATIEALAIASGPFAVHLRNTVGLDNHDPARSLIVDPDLPPAISLAGTDEPVGVRPEDRHVVSVQIKDDYGLTSVELHLESSTGAKRVDQVPTDILRDRSISREFPIDVADFELKPGQALTYRLRAVDNRPIPSQQETWTKPRTLMVEIKSLTPPDKELVERQQEIKDQIAELREDLAENKEALEKLHRQTEDESLKQKNSDKSEELAKLQQQQAELAERLQKLAAELAERELTEKLAERAQQLAERDLAEAGQNLERAAQGEPRDQLQPLSEAIDKLASVDKQLQSLDQQLNELKRLEQDLEKLDQLARNTERLADQLEKLDKQTQQAAAKPADANPEDPKTPKENPGAEQAANAAELEQQRQKLSAEGQKLADELADLLRKHPELLDAARRDQLQRLEQLAEQAEELAKPQEQLAKAFDEAAREAPASAQRPANNEAGANPQQSPMPNEGAPNAPNAGQPMNDPGLPQNIANQPAADPKNEPANAAAQAVKAQQQLAQEATRQALELAQKEGPESKATQAAAEFAKQAAAASRQAQTGDLEQAAEQGKAAAQAAQQAEKELSPEGQPANQQSQQASNLAQRQQQLAEQLEQLAGSKEAQQAAQEQGQKQLADATQALSKRLEEAAKNLESSPLDSKQAASAASKAQQATSEAQQAMKQAASAAKSDDPQAAAQQAAQAAEKLQQAAQEAQGAPGQPESGPAVPEELGAKVAQAAQQLQRAQQELNSAPNPADAENQPGQPGQPQPSQQPGQPGQQAGQPQAGQPQAGQPQPGQQPGSPQAGQPSQPGQPGQPGQAGQPGQNGQPQAGQPGQSQPGQSKPGQAQPGQPSSGQSQPGQGQPGQPGAPQTQLARSAEQFRQAAATMRRAANPEGQQSGPGNPNQQAGQPGQPGQPNGPAEAGEPGEPGQPGGAIAGGGGGAQAEPDLKQLDAELKKQGQRNWGKLPGQLRTEILQGANKKTRPEYARQIKSYFEEIAKPATRDTAPQN